MIGRYAGYASGARRAWAACALLSLMSGVACEPTTDGDARIAATAAREIVTDTGEIIGAVTIDQSELRSGERFELTVAIGADGDAPWTIQTIDLESALGEDFAYEFAASIPADDPSKVRRYEIESLLPGEYEIGPVEVTLARGDERITARTLEVLPVSVASAFAPDEEIALADVKGIVEPPRQPIAWWVWATIVGGAVALLALGIWLLIWLTRAREAKPIYRTAHELAFERLTKLEAGDLVSRGMLEELHDQASLILRRYIEDRFGLHAPERTTEEFLREARSIAVLLDSEVVALEVFLRQCDMIKFARFEPLAEHAGRTLQTVREFIERTKSDEKLVAFLDGRIVGRFDRAQLEKVA